MATKKRNIVEMFMHFVMKFAWLVIVLILAVTAFFAYKMTSIQFDANVFGFADSAPAPVFVDTPEEKPTKPLILKGIKGNPAVPDRGEVVPFEKLPNTFSESEYVNPIEYVEKEVLPYVYPEGRADEWFYDGYVIVFSSEDMFTPEVLNTLYDVRAKLSERWEIGACLSPFDFVTVEKKGTRLSILPIAPVRDGEEWTEADCLEFQRRLMNDSVAKDYLYSSDGTTIMLYYRARGLNAQSIQELDDIINPLRLYGRVALNGGGLLTNAVMGYLNRDLFILIGLCFAVILIVFYLSFKSVRAVLIPASLSLIGVVWTIGLMAIEGYKLTIVTVLTPCLVLTFGSSYSVHMLSEYFTAMARNEKDKMAFHYSKIGKTIFFAMMTTVSGFLSQLICRVPMFQEFGITIAYGVIICAILAFTYLPAVLSLTKALKQKQIKVVESGFMTSGINKMSGVIVRKWYIFMIILLVILVAFAFVHDEIGFDTNYMSYFPDDDPMLLDSQYFAKTLGGTDPYFITIVAPNNEPKFFLQPENLQAIYAYESAIMAADPDIVQILSFSQYVSFLNDVYNGEKGIPENAGLMNLLSRTLKQIANMLETDALDMLINEDASEITLSMRNYDYVEQNLQSMPSARRLEKTLDYYRYMLPEGTTSKIHSGAAAGLKASDMIMEDQNKATVISLALIFVFASLACLSMNYGIASLVPVMTGVMVNYVFMWLTGISFDIVTIGFSSVAIGAGVDDAIHFLTRLKMRRKEYPDEKYTDAIAANIRETGRPIILTTVSVDAGLAMLFFASFKPIKYFGGLMCLALTAAMLATLFILPPFLIMFDKLREKLGNK